MAVINSISGTRQKVLAILQREGSMTVDKLSREVGLSANTIRRHLDILQRDRLVSVDQVREKLGRPEYVYFLTDEGHESGYRDYKNLLTLMLNEIEGLSTTDLSNKHGRELLSFLIARIADKMSWPYLEPSRSTNEARVAKLEQALSDRGFSPEVTREGGNVHIRLCNCPFRSVALCQDSVCLLDHNLIANILGVEPVRESTIHGGHTSCVYVAAMET